MLEPVKDSPHVNHELVKEYIKIGGVRLEVRSNKPPFFLRYHTDERNLFFNFMKDDVVVTKDGYKNLTTVPKGIEEIEKMALSSV